MQSARLRWMRRFRSVSLLVVLAGIAGGGVAVGPAPSVAQELNSTAAPRADTGDPVPVAATTAAADNWALYRGDPLSSGVARGQLAEQLALRWKFAVPKGAFEGTAAIVDGVVYIGDLDGAVYALSLETGEKKWEYKVDSGFIAAPAVRKGLVYIGDYDGRFYCLEAGSGKLKWGFDTKAEIDASANFYQGNVLVGSQDATLYCLKSDTGELVWQHQIEDQIRCTPTVVEDRVFLAGCDGKLHIVDLTDGKTVAQVEIGAPTGVTPAVLGDRVYFGTENGDFFGINWRSAEVEWTFQSQVGAQAYRSSAAVQEGLVTVGARSKRVYGLDPKTGQELWSFAAKKRIDSSPVIVGERVFVGSADGRIYGLRAKDGGKVWEYEAGGGFTGSPAVADGCLVIASDDGVVYCFGGKNKT